MDAVVARPTLARLILRYAAEAEEHPTQGMFPAAERLLRMGWSLFEQGRASGELQPLHDDPFHAASAVIGATVFYVSALALCSPPAPSIRWRRNRWRPTSATRCAPRGACSASARRGACEQEPDDSSHAAMRAPVAEVAPPRPRG